MFHLSPNLQKFFHPSFLEPDHFEVYKNWTSNFTPKNRKKSNQNGFQGDGLLSWSEFEQLLEDPKLRFLLDKLEIAAGVPWRNWKNTWNLKAIQGH